MPPATSPRSPQPAFRSAESRGGESRGCFQSEPDQARTSPEILHMDVGRFELIRGVEKQPVWARTKNRRQRFQCIRPNGPAGKPAEWRNAPLMQFAESCRRAGVAHNTTGWSTAGFQRPDEVRRTRGNIWRAPGKLCKARAFQIFNGIGRLGRV